MPGSELKLVKVTKIQFPYRSTKIEFQNTDLVNMQFGQNYLVCLQFVSLSFVRLNAEV